MSPASVIRETGHNNVDRAASQESSSLTTSANDYPTDKAAFEWINVQEKDTTGRIKAHVRRELKRRQKAEGLRFQQLRAGTGKKLISAVSPVSLVSPLTNDGKEIVVEDKLLSPPKVVIAASTSVSPAPMTILDGARVEPFDVLPAKLNSHKDLGFIHHYHKIFSPKPFELSNWDYSPMRHITLGLAMKDPAAFLLLVSGSATDLALRLDSRDSPEAIGYRAKGMTMVNRRMMVPSQAISDGAITACVVLSGLELLWGNPRTYNIHMDGLCQMIRLRGGFAAVQATNPLLTSLVAWHDYAGAAALISKRRFEFLSSPVPPKNQPTRPRQYMPPLNGPFGNLPPNYTLYEDLMIILEGLENTTALIRQTRGLDKHRSELHSKFVKKLNDDLNRMIDDPSRQSVPFRRFLIEDSFRLAALIYISGVSKEFPDWQSCCDRFIRHLEPKLIDTTKGWGKCIDLVLKLLMTGGSVHSEQNAYYVLQLMDFFITLSWSDWKLARDTLLDFLLHNEICEGELQDFWLRKKGV